MFGKEFRFQSLGTQHDRRVTISPIDQIIPIARTQRDWSWPRSTFYYKKPSINEETNNGICYYFGRV